MKRCKEEREREREREREHKKEKVRKKKEKVIYLSAHKKCVMKNAPRRVWDSRFATAAKRKRRKEGKVERMVLRSKLQGDRTICRK